MTYDLRRSPALNGVGEHKYSCLLQGKRYEPGEFFTHSFDVHVMDVSCMCFVSDMACSILCNSCMEIYTFTNEAMFFMHGTRSWTWFPW